MDAETKKAFDEWQKAFNASDDDYQDYYQKQIEEEAFPAVRSLSYDTTTCTGKGSGSETGTHSLIGIDGSHDDGCWQGSTFIWPSQVVGYYGALYFDGFFHFKNVGIPRGARINYAKLQVYGDNLLLANSIDITIDGQLGSSAAAPTSVADITSRPRTTYDHTWASPPIFEYPVYTTNIACIIQEIIDSDDWGDTGGNVLLFMDSTDMVYLDVTELATILHIYWDEIFYGSGGAIVGGAAEVQGGRTYLVGSGGATMGGGASITSNQSYNPLGGVLTGSEAIGHQLRGLTICVPSGRVQSDLEGFYLLVELAYGDGTNYTIPDRAIDVWQWDGTNAHLGFQMDLKADEDNTMEIWYQV